MLMQLVNYDLAALKKQEARYQQQAKNLQQRRKEFAGSAAASRAKYKAACSDLGIDGTYLHDEIAALARSLPALFDKAVALLRRDEFQRACDYYAAFVPFMGAADSADVHARRLPITTHLSTHGNTPLGRFPHDDATRRMGDGSGGSDHPDPAADAVAEATIEVIATGEAAVADSVDRAAPCIADEGGREEVGRHTMPGQMPGATDAPLSARSPATMATPMETPAGFTDDSSAPNAATPGPDRADSGATSAAAGGADDTVLHAGHLRNRFVDELHEVGTAAHAAPCAGPRRVSRRRACRSCTAFSRSAMLS